MIYHNKSLDSINITTFWKFFSAEKKTLIFLANFDRKKVSEKAYVVVQSKQFTTKKIRMGSSNKVLSIFPIFSEF